MKIETVSPPLSEASGSVPSASAEKTPVELAAPDLYAALKDLWQWAIDPERGAYVPDGLGQHVMEAIEKVGCADQAAEHSAPALPSAAPKEPV